MVLIKYSGKYVKIYFNMKITFQLSLSWVMMFVIMIFHYQCV